MARLRVRLGVRRRDPPLPHPQLFVERVLLRSVGEPVDFGLEGVVDLGKVSSVILDDRIRLCPELLQGGAIVDARRAFSSCKA